MTESKNAKKNALPANVKARKKYMAENTKLFGVLFNKKTDADVIAFFESVPNKTDFVRQCIKEKMAEK